MILKHKLHHPITTPFHQWELSWWQLVYTIQVTDNNIWNLSRNKERCLQHRHMVHGCKYNIIW